MAEAYALSEEQKAEWETHKILQLDDFLSEEVKEKIPAWVAVLEELPEKPGAWMKYFEVKDGERKLCRMENFLEHSEGLAEIAWGQRSLDLLSQLFGEPAVLFKEKINFKLAGSQGFAPHQDAPAYVSFNQKYHITMMVALDDATVQNGCLHVVKGGQYKETLPQNPADGSISSELSEKMEWVPVECKRGSILLFDSLVPHYSPANHSENPRRALFLTFNAVSEGGSKRQEYYADKREKFPPDCERDPNKDYSAGAAIYNVGNPLPTGKENAAAAEENGQAE